MGNHSNKQTNRMSKSSPNYERIRDRSEQRQMIDLDELVEQWAWYMWNRTKTKAFSHYKREDLIISINWKRVNFTQNNVHFYGSPPIRLPQSQILFRTNFNNKTNCEQAYQLKTERSTRSTFRFTFTQSLTKSQESVIIFRLPEEIVEVGGGVKREQSIGFGQDTEKDYEMRWSVNSQIRVAPRTCTKAELVIDEEEFHGDFSLPIQFYGRITATVSARQSPNVYLKFMDGDIVQIIRDVLETNRRLTGLEIQQQENLSIVQFTMRGKCAFRYGIQQHVVLNQESIDSTLSSFLISNYRPLRTHVTSSSSDLHLHIDENDDHV